MKKAIVIILGLAIIGGVLFLGYRFSQKSPAPIPPEPSAEIPAIQSTTACYEYQQVATKDAPYTVNEQVTLTTASGIVTGTKTGNQFGPNMSNGYEGTITGTKGGDIITAIFNYTIEGSNNNEQEEYQVTTTALIKHRYPLKDENGILVPDKAQSKQDLVYKRVTCEEAV